MSKDLCIAVKAVWFYEIKAAIGKEYPGAKKDEYRLVNDYWRKRLEGKTYDTVTITLGYPPKTNTDRRITFAWDGFKTEILNHPEFGEHDVAVYAISLRGKVLS